MNPLTESLACLAALTSAAHAQVHAGDIIVDTSSGVIEVGYEDGTFQRDCVFVMRDFADGQTNDPGFDSLNGTFRPGEAVGFDLLAALRKWDGDDFDEIPPEQIRVTSGFFGPTVTPTNDQSVTGFSLEANGSGKWHKHLLFTLTSPASDGVYLAQMRLGSGSGLIAPSEPFWLVFEKNAPGDLADAQRWVRDNLSWCDVSPCPADLTGEGDVNTNDFFLFLSYYQAMDPRADFAPDGAINTNDFFAFMSAYQDGC